ncbi:DSBA-like thioredoxin domain protein [Neocallimastix lanati (nom. inval.)]|uniref:DSBA-like thioredoxin domain protein n=1 Tax=Neocallimastix californiae TaxID=1754190 RepID=A0A1Y2E9A0_9FUNG|nr:DSBA-like thioredoxin domain protein [Neocallimastix sp. JGI-2020a]ORY68119.1 DSBA-like thioredoxin domain protein [Neocallimastix californiae]|eukprot:ORY68119.1 DSBA-like thioredoxin domain protein [Neocallimastix californiae]
MASMKKLDIVYWSDYACPYCYIGEKRLESVLKDMKIDDMVNLKMKSFELNPNASSKVESKTDVRFALKYGMSIEGARRQIDQISKLGRDEGIDFRYADTLYTNMLDAHRLTKLAESKGKDVDKVIYLLFDAYFTKNLVLSDRSVLIKIGKEVGLEEKEIIEMLDSDKFKDEIRKDESEAYKMGVQGVPFFVINDKFRIYGCQSKNGMKKVLMNALDDQLETSGSGMFCGPNGCH